MTARQTTNYIPTLDGWRAIAILLVLFNHYGMAEIWSWPSLTAVSDRAWIGVDIFFVLSGFLICTRLLDEKHDTGTINLRTFYLRRAFRILPPYLAYLAVVSGLTIAGKGPAVGKLEIVSCLLFFRNYVASLNMGTWFTAHFWSLSVEEHFYLTWPLLLVLLSRRKALIVAVCLTFAVAVWRVIDSHTHIAYGLLGSGILWRTDMRADALLLGCIAAIRYEQASRWMTRLRFSSAAALLAGIILLFLIFYPIPMGRTWSDLAIAAMIAGSVSSPSSLLGRILENPVLRWLGRLSYSIYIWQELFILQAGIPTFLGSLQTWPTNVAPILLAAAASHYLLEIPMINLGRDLVRPLQQGSRQATVIAAAGEKSLSLSKASQAS